ncbi:uncharacterized protein LOC112511519 isoform X2 [Cynara cardunculus var. scolymus]|uniref:uncharacterized protein LOC112511519 isoform X2 n=1 Tax=Cynara cardunculus var. scolymus TaxID=59895 RepID=UPI000D623D1E|nr:uncharacterized protein LOC112511519 isoform X2 [Cynara cardunculus var. scolymus]
MKRDFDLCFLFAVREFATISIGILRSKSNSDYLVGCSSPGKPIAQMSKSNSDDLGGWSSPEKPIAPKLNRSSISSYLSSLEVLLAIPLHPSSRTCWFATIGG